MVKWNDECQEAYEKIKQYLTNPPVLPLPMPGVPLILYLSIKEVALGAMLA